MLDELTIAVLAVVNCEAGHVKLGSTSEGIPDVLLAVTTSSTTCNNPLNSACSVVDAACSVIFCATSDCKLDTTLSTNTTSPIVER